MSLFERSPLDIDTISPGLRGLILANFILFVIQWMAGPVLIDLFGLVPNAVVHKLWLWQLISYMFLHGGVLHIFFNMLMLWMFGSVLEGPWGTAEFMRYYFVCGIGAGLASVALGLLTHAGNVPTIGASGAIFGLLTAFAMVYPDAVVYVWLFIPMRARTMAVVLGAVELFLTMGSSNSGVSSIAHLGGMVTGYVYLRYGWEATSRVRRLGRALAGKVEAAKPEARRRRREAQGAEDLEAQANRILDKVLIQGEASLTPEEREIMRRYSRRSQN